MAANGPNLGIFGRFALLCKSSLVAVMAFLSYIEFTDNKSGLGAPIACREAELYL
jgi:hypothetical protein